MSVGAGPVWRNKTASTPSRRGCSCGSGLGPLASHDLGGRHACLRAPHLKPCVILPRRGLEIRVTVRSSLVSKSCLPPRSKYHASFYFRYHGLLLVRMV